MFGNEPCTSRVTECEGLRREIRKGVMLHISSTLAAELLEEYSRRAYGKRKESEPDLENEIEKDASPQNVGSQGGEDMNSVHTLEPSAKAIEETSLLVEMENCQLETEPLVASPKRTCESHTLSNFMHEPKKDSIIQRDSSGILQKLKSKLIESNYRKLDPQNNAPITFLTGSKSFDEILESVIKNLLNINLSKKEDQPLRCLTEEDISTDEIEVTSENLDTSEIIHKAKEQTSLQKNPLYKRRGKMTSNGHLENYKPQQLMGNLDQTNNN
eukprot:Gb_02769 [translate_table: standard]